ncbi:tyrosine-type recombinase/integrase [Candidatus Woesearchaeota archaeon]|nr:tyrosine-type recombinase/integrase [Candidatus Woesearchaeota archaeon]
MFSNIKVRDRSGKKGELKQRFRNFVLELRVRNFSDKTIYAYLYHISRFLDSIGKEQRSISSRDIRAYIQHIFLRGAGPRTINTTISALKCYFEGYLKKRLFKDIKRAKVPKDMVPVLSRQEVRSMIDAAGSLKHRLLIELLYSSGIRVGECVRLKKKDIIGNMVFIRKGKGKKDRFAIASMEFFHDLKIYLAVRKNNSEYIFDSSLNPHLTIRGAEDIVKTAARDAGIERNVYPHLLRACFTTHLLEDGVEDFKVQRLLGHSDIKTTMGYNRLRTDSLKGIKSPLDD